MPKLSVLDFILLEKILHFTITEFTFERRNETLGLLKGDLENIIVSEQDIINNTKRIFGELDINSAFKTSLLEFIEQPEIQKYGFFYAKFFLEDLLISFKEIHYLFNLYD